MGKVGDQDREFDCICITIRFSAFPVRMSYNVKVRSVPILASTEDSDILKRTDVIVSVDVGKVRSEMGAFLKPFMCIISYVYKHGTHLVSSQICTMLEEVANIGSVRW